MQKPHVTIVFLMSRDARNCDREKAAKHFLAFCRETFGDPMDARHIDTLKSGRMPYGWFAAYTQDNGRLRQAYPNTRCSAYRNCLRRYEHAVQGCMSEKSAVAEYSSEPAAVAAHSSPALASCAEATDEYRARFNYVTPRTGTAYVSRRCTFARTFERRRGVLGGRPRQATILRELLIDWYSRIRHSANCKIMCPFPLKVPPSKSPDATTRVYG